MTASACSPAPHTAPPPQDGPAATAEAPKGEPSPPSPHQLTCAAFPERTTRTDLEQRFGKANVTDEALAVGEGETERGLVVFANDPTRRLEIFMGAKTKGIAMIRTAGPGSVWEGPKGLRVGAPFTAVESLNGRMFMTTGFFWDYGGRVTNWGSDGAFAVQEDGCGILAAFDSPSDPNKTVPELIGDRVFSSQVAAIRALNPKVREIGLGYPQPD
jgi:hypothetical protein